jgi:recombination protein RecA
MEVRRSEQLKNNGEIIGNRVKVKIVKNKVAPPFRECEFDIMYGEGISKVGNILDIAVNMNIVEKAGAWFSYGGNRIAQGRDNAKKYLENNPEICAEVEKKIRDNMAEAFDKSLTEDLEKVNDDDDDEFDEDEE